MNVNSSAVPIGESDGRNLAGLGARWALRDHDAPGMDLEVAARARAQGRGLHASSLIYVERSSREYNRPTKFGVGIGRRPAALCCKEPRVGHAYAFRRDPKIPALARG